VNQPAARSSALGAGGGTNPFVLASFHVAADSSAQQFSLDHVEARVGAVIILRHATMADIPILEVWDREPHVISATTDEPDEDVAFGDHDWNDELARFQENVWEYLIAELDGRPIGGMLMIDPQLESTHYWGDIGPNLRALDIWIGDAADHGKGYGEIMMRLAIQKCFAASDVTAIVIDPLASNTRAHRFYERLGFVAEGRRMFGPDDCLVHRLTRDAWIARWPDDGVEVRQR
jgi:aminoglycoside 6'-N-acetyltransferase